MNDIMRKIKSYLIIIITLFLVQCESTWDDHYSMDEGFIDRSIWEEISTNPDYSVYKSYIEDFELQGYFQNSDTLKSTKTVFIPSNSAFQKFTGENNTVNASLILYHLVKSQFLLSNIEGNLKSMAQNSKFLYFEENDGIISVDGIILDGFTNRFVDGVIYKLDEVLSPKPSIAEYIYENAGYFDRYISSFDTLVMDYVNSEIIEIDFENDLVIYDSAYIILNEFKNKYFDVDYNTRDTFATMLLYTNEQFDGAMDLIASELGYASGHDLPLKWIEEVYFEYYLKTAFYEGLLSYEDFSGDYVVNILGDTVEVDYSNLNQEKVICSNGLIYHYKQLVVPESLYKSDARTEGEALAYMDIDGELVLNPDVNVVYKDKSGNNLSLDGKINYVLGAAGIASNDSALQISLGSDFQGSFEMEVFIRNVFPGRYLLDWAGFSSLSGVYKVYINDSLIYTRLPFEPASAPGSVISEFDSYNFGNFTLKDLPLHENGINWGSLRATNNTWNINEFYVESDWSDPEEYYLKDFGDVRVRFEFVNSSPSNSGNTGIVIDYLNLRQR